MAAVQVLQVPQSIVGQSCPDYEISSKGRTNSPLNEQYFHCHSAIAANRKTPRARPTPTTKSRARSLSLSDTGACDSSDDDDFNAPITPPPIIRSLSRYVHLAKAQHKPYERRDPSTLQRRYTASQLSPTDSRTLPDARKGKELIENRLQHLSSEAIAQAVVTKQADVEWRRVRALATAWEIQAIEEHKRFLQMVLVDDGDTYASAASEPWSTSLQELSRGSVDELDERLHFCAAVYDPDLTSLAVGDRQLDLLEDITLTQRYVAGDPFQDFASLDDSKDQRSGSHQSEALLQNFETALQDSTKISDAGQ